MESIWSEKIELPRFRRLEGDAKTDVLIIGGGMAGLLCAYFLQQQGVDYMLVERNRICGGVTEHTTAKITAQHGLFYHKMLKSIGVEKTRMYLEANQNAVRKYFEICSSIDCDFEEQSNYVYSLKSRRKIEKEADAIRKSGFAPVVTRECGLPIPVVQAVGLKHQAQFHPLKFVRSISPGLKIYEQTFVKKLKEHTAVTQNGKIRFQKLIFATHFPIDNKHGLYFLKMYQNRSYVLALENAKHVGGMYVDESKNGLSFRNYGKYLLLGGGSHRTGKNGGGWKELRSFARLQYPGAKEIGCWAAQDCMTLDGIPYIGRYADAMPHCYVATGFNKWGMTSSMVAAMILTDMVLEKENEYASVFEPSRSMMKPQLLLNGFEAAAGLFTFSTKRCPHLGCALKWNPMEHSWDCPCHGSRFTRSGRLLDNPANGNLFWR